MDLFCLYSSIELITNSSNEIMKLFALILTLFLPSVAMADSTSELLVNNIKLQTKSYTCNVTDINTLDYKEIVVCVKGRDMRAIELINFWITNFTAKSSTDKERLDLEAKANHLIKGATYVMSIKDSKGDHMTAFCSDCESIESASLLNDKSSFVFDNLKNLAKSM